MAQGMSARAIAVLLSKIAALPPTPLARRGLLVTSASTFVRISETDGIGNGRRAMVRKLLVSTLTSLMLSAIAFGGAGRKTA